MARSNFDTYIDKAFHLAVILSRNVEHAEPIVATAIEAVSCDDFSEAALLAEVANVAWNIPWDDGQITAEGRDLDLPQVPEEIQGVFDLPKILRYCFSMRVVAGITTQVCARLIGLHPEQVNYFVQLSMRMLAKAAQSREQSGSLVSR